MQPRINGGSATKSNAGANPNKAPLAMNTNGQSINPTRHAASPAAGIRLIHILRCMSFKRILEDDTGQP
jgi:hypothetical protein